MYTLLIFIAVLAVLVLSHELGHFLAARKSGMRVHEFGFGFPPRAFGWYRDPATKKIKFVGAKYEVEKAPATVYSLNWLPLGGFVKIKGEDGENNESDSFGVKPVWKRVIVVVAGVTMNIIVAFILLSIGYLSGVSQAVDGFSEEQLANVKDHRTEVLQVLPGKPAEQAGIQPGDSFFQVGDIREPRLKQLQDYVDAHRNQEILVRVKRGEETLEKKITPVINEGTNRAGIGVAIAEVGTVSYPWYRAIYEGALSTGWYLKEIVLAFGGLIKGLFTGAGVGGDVSGPVGIAVMTGRVARLGFSYLLQFTALLSLNLAVLNILPIPALDGGRLLFLLVGKIRRKPVDQKWERISHAIGFTLLMLLVVVVTTKDLFNFKGAITNFINRIF